ncbi:MAG TPA: hypothetical protein VIA62_07710 [Thermoanaerobaculia bacterium]|jgi:hypothetical protein|nr:hypothetical protein [Thermoanaerobaculia bacterium]
MKKTLNSAPKLKLHRETLRGLTSTNLADAAGAATTAPCTQTCYSDCHQFSCRTTC